MDFIEGDGFQDVINFSIIKVFVAPVPVFSG